MLFKDTCHINQIEANVMYSPGHKRDRTNSNQVSPMLGNNGPREHQQPSPMHSNNRPFQQDFMPGPDVRTDAAIDPALASEGLNRLERVQDQGYKDAIRAWSRFRFVRAGWFTPGEAIDYIA